MARRNYTKKARTTQRRNDALLDTLRENGYTEQPRQAKHSQRPLTRKELRAAAIFENTAH